MRIILPLLALFLSVGSTFSQDLILLNGQRTKVLSPGKYVTLELEPESPIDCDCKRQTVYGRFVRTSVDSVFMYVHREISYLSADGIITRKNVSYADETMKEMAYLKSTVLSITKSGKPKSMKSKETFAAIGALLIFTGIATSTSGALTLETGPRGKVVKAGMGQMVVGIVMASIFGSKKRFVVSKDSNHYKGRLYRIR